ncbi:HET-C domain protein [Morchella snyderi]|nr:HET-C domain protein [Morchella snyderi]
MATHNINLVVLSLLLFLVFATPAAAFGAGNIASISKIEGHNWRHGDIEDTLKTLLALQGGKWTTMNIRRVYFGNWLRDYSQALDVGTLKSVNKDTIRVLVWVLSFLSFGYATGEFEVTEDRLGVYRPEEHIDNPKGYADGMDARVYDPRLRPQVLPIELGIDPWTGMKNYIANESGGWATSVAYVRESLARSIHFGRLYTSGGHGVAGNEADLCEALRCLGQALHCLEDFSAHSNYVELVLRDLGFLAVFPHTGVNTAMIIGAPPPPPPPGTNPSQVPVHFPLVTGTFGAVDFLHSVLGEAQDKFSQTEVDPDELSELNAILGDAHEQQKKSKKSGQKSMLQDLFAQIPNMSGFSSDADRLEADSNAKEMANMHISPQGTRGPGPAAPGSFDPVKTARDIYPILEFRDKVMRAIESTIEKVPGLSALVEKISDTLAVFVLGLLAPYVQPLIAQASLGLKESSSQVVDSSAQQQFAPWDDADCTDPTHSLLSKDHFSNILNAPAGEIASAIVSYTVPRIVYAWERPDTPLEVVIPQILTIFHHPALRRVGQDFEIQGIMYSTVQRWVDRLPDRGASLSDVLSSEGVKQGRNHTGGVFCGGHGGGHGKTKGGEWDKAKKSKKDGKGKKNDPFANIPGVSSTSGGGVSVGGIKLPGAIGGALGGFLDAANQGYNNANQKKSKDGKSKDKDKDEKKKKDKYDDQYENT